MRCSRSVVVALGAVAIAIETRAEPWLELATAAPRTADLGEVLARTPGVSVRRAGALGERALLALDGFQVPQVRVYIDGVPAELRFASEVADIPVTLLERIEVHPGAVPIAFGADALGGVVNLVSDASHTTRNAASYQLGSFGTHRLTLESRYRHGPSGLVVGLDVFADSALNNYPIEVWLSDGQGLSHPATVKRFHDHYAARGVSFLTGVVERPYAKKLLLRVFANGYEKELQRAYWPWNGRPFGEVNYGASLRGLELYWAHSLERTLDWELFASYTYRSQEFVDFERWRYDWYGRRTERANDTFPGFATIQKRGRHTGYARARLAWQPLPEHTIELAVTPELTGLSASDRVQTDPNGLEQAPDRRYFKMVSGLSYTLNAFSSPGSASDAWLVDARGTGRLQAVVFAKDYRYRVSADDAGLPPILDRDSGVYSRHDFGYGAGARYVFSEWLLARASYERTFRLPDVEEVLGTQVVTPLSRFIVEPNLELEPERSQNADFRVRFQHGGPRRGDLVVDVSAFFRDTEKVTVANGFGGSTFASAVYGDYENQLSTRTLGLSGTVSFQACRYLQLNGNVTWLRQRLRASEDSFDIPHLGERIPGRPWFYGSWGAHARFAGVLDPRDELSPFYVGRFVHDYLYYWPAPDAAPDVVPSLLTHGIGFSYAVLRRFGRVTSSFELHNLANARVYDFFGEERPGRAFAMKLTAEL